MIGLVLVTHGRLAEEMRAAMEHVVGPQRNVAALCIGAEDDMDRRRADVQRCIDQVDTGDGVVLLTDMFGGSPSNLCISMMTRPNVEVIGGMNLPMLVKLAKVRGKQTLSECVDSAEMAGRKYIGSASHLLQHCLTNGTLNGTLTGTISGNLTVTCAPSAAPALAGPPAEPISPISGSSVPYSALVSHARIAK